MTAGIDEQGRLIVTLDTSLEKFWAQSIVDKKPALDVSRNNFGITAIRLIFE